MHKDVFGKTIVNGYCGVKVKDAAPTIGFFIDQNIHIIVWHRRSHIADGTVVVSQGVPFRIESTVGK